MLTYSFAERGEMGLYEYLYLCIKRDIERGAIAAGEKLPSKRSFARHLGVSLITVEGAYAQLVAEGYLRTEPRRGYYACDLASVQPFPRAGAGGAGTRASGASRLADAEQPEEGLAQAYASLAAVKERSCPKGKLLADFTGGSSSTELFPYTAWAKSVREALTCEAERSLVGDVGSAGTARLRQAIAAHLKGFRGMEVNPDCIVVGAGSQVLYNWIIQLLGRGLRYGVEDPGYVRLTQIYRANDVRLSAVPLDEQGVCLRSVRSQGVDVLHLMPSHQYPTGLVTSVSRRYELLGWASEEEGRYLVEDDYDCEFRLTGRPIPSLQSIDALGKVVYTNTFTKSLGPAFRIGYMVLPPVLAKRFHDELGFYSCTVSAIDQLALARFIESGDYERHVNRMRTHYRDVRDALIGALRQSGFSGRISIERQDAGIHFLLGIEAPKKANALEWERAFAQRCAQGGVRIRPLSSFCLNSENAAPADCPVRRFVVSYGGVDASCIPEAVDVLEQAAEAADGITLR